MCASAFPGLCSGSGNSAVGAAGVGAVPAAFVLGGFDLAAMLLPVPMLKSNEEHVEGPIGRQVWIGSVCKNITARLI